MAKKALNPVYSNSPEITPGFEGPVGYRADHDIFLFSNHFKDWLFAFQGGHCGYCGVHLGEGWKGNRKAHVEHVVSRRLGGSDLPPNIMFACSKCNMQKRDKHFSVLTEHIQLRDTGLGDIINIEQARKLVAVGVDIGLKPARPFHFSRMNWAHVQPAVEVDRQRMAEEFTLSQRRT